MDAILNADLIAGCRNCTRNLRDQLIDFSGKGRDIVSPDHNLMRS